MPPQRVPGDLTLRGNRQVDALTRDQLVRVTEELELGVPTATSKHELVEAIVRQGGIPANALLKEELLRVARNTGSEVNTSMTKAELIAQCVGELRCRRRPQAA